MSSLSGQQINQSYQGLLKLATSTTGITSTFQSIEDGLGNNTGLKISTSGLTGPNLVSYPIEKFNKGGMGGTFNANTNANSYQGDEYDAFFYYPFYDAGETTYTQMSVRLTQVTSTSDVFTGAFYTLQNTSTSGLGPKEVVMSGISIPTTGSTGIRTFNLPSSLKFPSPGFYAFCFLITNTGVGPTAKYVRPTDTIYSATCENLVTLGYGTQENTYGRIPMKVTNLTFCAGYYDAGFIPFKSSYTAANLDANTYFTSTKPIGFLLS